MDDYNQRERCPNAAPMLPQCCPNAAPMLPQCWLNAVSAAKPSLLMTHIQANTKRWANVVKKGFFQFKVIINVPVTSFCFIWIHMLWVYGHCKYSNSFRAGIVSKLEMPNQCWYNVGPSSECAITLSARGPILFRLKTTTPPPLPNTHTPRE